MIVQQTLEENPTLIKTWSDANFYIKKVGTEEIYAEAIDPVDMHREYVETDMLIPEPEPEPKFPTLEKGEVTA